MHVLALVIDKISAAVSVSIVFSKSPLCVFPNITTSFRMSINPSVNLCRSIPFSSYESILLTTLSTLHASMSFIRSNFSSFVDRPYTLSISSSVILSAA